MKILCDTENSHFDEPNQCRTCGKDIATLLAVGPSERHISIEEIERSQIRKTAHAEIAAGRVSTGLALLEMLRGLKDLEATCVLASMYDQGKYVLRDSKRSIEMFTEAARGGSAYARYNLGVLVLKHQDDRTTALKLFRQAASSRNAHPRIRAAAQRAIAWIAALKKHQSSRSEAPASVQGTRNRTTSFKSK